ncbi:hypothetical protein CROQUDRAFT_101356 [Cronartium quercuum f. sp. fusiforme G11]|uniref:Uncharacterized protein n=1 Tax=Cronartium quercuum f. sp. fusiforme G11 TaxID=708437 RepID=A0A9P6N920_9BASI|nr:hypothetical protein CROQUDRAFT_101356 [Cronartium quercuum f. sp. fusiforme G11]
MGASHYMLNDKKLFMEGTLVENKDPSVLLRLAGGNATLPIEGFAQSPAWKMPSQARSYY